MATRQSVSRSAAPLGLNPAGGQDYATKSYVDTADATKVPTSRVLAAGFGILSLGNLSADRTIGVDFGAGTNQVPPTTRAITAGTGLTGGGNLQADRTLAVAYGATSTTACVGNDARLAPLGTAVTVASPIQVATTTTTSATFVDLATTVAVTFVVPPSGKVIVTVGADLWSSSNGHSWLGYRISGVNTVAALVNAAARVFGPDGVKSTSVDFQSGLTAGATNTATLQVMTDAGFTASAADKMLIVQPVI